MRKFILYGDYGRLLRYHGVPVSDILERCGLAPDLFESCAPPAVMTAEEYLAFTTEIGRACPDPSLPVRIACTGDIESFAASIFAAYASRNGRVCLDRLAFYKELVGPLAFAIEEEANVLTVRLHWADLVEPLSPFLAQSELAFIVNLLRKGSGEHITPARATLDTDIPSGPLEHFLGTRIAHGTHSSIAFRTEDLLKPFASRSEAIWNFLEPKLALQMEDLQRAKPRTLQVRRTLIELLPSGQGTIGAVSRQLAIPPRTLQRHLASEGTTFRDVLDDTRLLLVRHYVLRGDLTDEDIAHLVGYREKNSLLRAFQGWTGTTLPRYRKGRPSMGSMPTSVPEAESVAWVRRRVPSRASQSL